MRAVGDGPRAAAGLGGGQAREEAAARASPAGFGSPLSEFADSLRQQVDIVEVIGEHVALRPAGRSYKGLCPFHAEKTPSFTVSPDRQLYYCFGCGAGGNVYTFLMAHQGMSFPEAVLYLARRAGLEREAERLLARGGAGGPSQGVAGLREVVEAAARWFAAQLWEGPQGEAARRYLAGRGVTEETARRFGLGYAPDRWHDLEEALRARGFARPLLEQAGLVVARAGAAAGVYDRFRGRLIFPISDGQGRVVGFAGRALQEGQEPKYLNSPETPLYQKSRLLYGLAQAREAIRRRDRVVVVEGYMDVLALHQAGLQEAVATCGTSLTAEHGRLLGRLAGRVVVAYDADAAGQAAALRGLKHLSSTGLEVRVAVLPAGHDPDSLVRAFGPEAMEQVLEEARGVYEFAVERALSEADLRTPEGKARAVANVLPILAEVPGAVEQEALVLVVARRLGVAARSVRRDLWRYQRQAGRGGRPAAGPVRVPAGYTAPGHDARRLSSGPGLPVERALLKLLLDVPDLAASLAGRLSGADFSHAGLGRLFEALVARGGGALADPELASLAGAIVAGSEVACPAGQLDQYAQQVRLQRAQRELARLEANIEAVMAGGVAAGQVLESLAELVVSYREVRDRLRHGGGC